MNPDKGFIEADRALVSALANGDAGAAAKLVDDDFTWVDMQEDAAVKTIKISKASRSQDCHDPP
jgi:hypothetical protein